MANDIIAESQTQRTVDTLLRGEADSKSQQVALASLLLAVTKQNETLVKQSEELQEIKNSLWTKTDMETYIDSRHAQHCVNCPAKRYVDALNTDRHQIKKQRPWLVELITSESLRYFVLVLILVWTVVVMKTSTDEAASVMEHVQQTLTGKLTK